MYTVYDYLKYYNNVSFEESTFNDMDNIVFATLAYFPFPNTLKRKDLSLLDKKILNIKESNTLIGKKAIEIIKIISKGTRYKKIIFSNYASLVDDNVQFNAITIRFNNNCYVSFCGTDNSLVGWKENFNLSYMYPVLTQKLAIDYLKQTICDKDQAIYVGGHSKGGNLAMASVMEASDDIYGRINTVYNNDGPGFLKNEFTSIKYNRLLKKLKNILPEESLVGILLDNKEYNIVKSKNKGPYQHDLTSWLCFGPFLVEGSLNNYSKKLQAKLNNWLVQVNDDTKQILIDSFFNVIEESGVKHFRELKKLKWPELSSMIKEAKNIDNNTRPLLVETLKTLIEIEKQ